MISREKRKFERPDIFLIIKFRKREKSYRYSLGVTSNVSQGGIKFEASDSSFGPGEVLEILLKHPLSELSVAASGQIVWKRAGWYEYELGLQLHDMDQAASRTFLDLMTSAKENPVGPHLNSEDYGDEDDQKKVQMLSRKLSVRPISALPPVKEVKSDKTFFSQKHDHASRVHAEAPREKKNIHHRERIALMRMFLIQQKNRGWSAMTAWAGLVKKSLLNTDRITTFRMFIKNEKNRKWPTILSRAVLFKGALLRGDRMGSMKIFILERQKEEWIIIASLAFFIILSAAFITSGYMQRSNHPMSAQVGSEILQESFDDKEIPEGERNEYAQAVKYANNAEPDSSILPQDHVADNQAPVFASSLIADVNADQQLTGKGDEPENISSVDGNIESTHLKEEITFDSDSDFINPLFYPLIDKVVMTLMNNPETIVQLEGHSDNVGVELYNINVSMRRALAVRKQLMKKGIDKSRITMIVSGDANPVAPNISMSGRMRNRRVEMKIIPSIN